MRAAISEVCQQMVGSQTELCGRQDAERQSEMHNHCFIHPVSAASALGASEGAANLYRPLIHTVKSNTVYQKLTLHEQEITTNAYGNYRLTSEFYKVFINDISKFLLGVYEEAINKGSLPTTIRQCVITLITKHQKDILLLENRQPIS